VEDGKREGDEMRTRMGMVKGAVERDRKHPISESSLSYFI
jgi:hypothetical protein